MRLSFISKFFLIILLFCTSTIYAANLTFPEFKNDSIYKSLVNNRLSLKSDENRLNVKLDSLRKYYSTAPDSARNTLSEKILSIESQLYEVRSNIADTDLKINSIEQKNLLQTIRNGYKTDSENQNNLTESNFKKSRYLLNNRFLVQNLPIDEVQKLRSVQKNETIIKNLETEFKNNYAQLDKIKNEYDSVKTQYQADSLFEIYSTLTKQGLILEDSLEKIWTPSFDTKIYIYNYLLDKINRIDLLEDLNVKFNEIQSTNIDENSQSERFASLVQYRTMILNYELAIAEVFDLTEAYDSLKSEFDNIQNTPKISFPKIELQRLDFTPYSRVTTKSEQPYTSKNPIPRHQQPQVPIVYKIQLGTFQKIQPVSIFRKVQPLSIERLPNGHYRYYAGLYKNYEELLEDIEYLKKIGFRRPEPVVWDRGVYINLAQDEGKVFRVEFSCKDNILNDSIRELISVYAQEKETSRINTDTETLFVVGTFESRVNALELTRALNNLENVSAKVTEVEL